MSGWGAFSAWLTAVCAARGMSELTADVSKVTHQTGARSKPTSGDRDEMCYYHRNFGSKAQKCRKPCSYKAEN